MSHDAYDMNSNAQNPQVRRRGRHPLRKGTANLILLEKNLKDTDMETKLTREKYNTKKVYAKKQTKAHP